MPGALFGSLVFLAVILFAPDPVGAAGAGFSIQLNAYKDETNARKFVKHLKGRGYDPFIVKSEGRNVWYRIMLGHFSSKQKARQKMAVLNHQESLQAIVVPAVANSAPVSQARSKEPVIITESFPVDLSKKPGSPENDSVETVLSHFLEWKSAWEERRVYQYLDYYSDSFKHESRSMEDWKNSRILALMNNDNISVDFKDIKIFQGDGVIKMTFIQKYRSDKVDDEGRKVLLWKREGQGWKIVSETWEAI